MRSSLNLDTVLAPHLKKNGLYVFLIHWMAWLVLHFVTFLPTLVNTTRFFWESFLFTHVVLVTINFLLFYAVAFYIMPLIGTFQKKWFLIVIASLVITILFTYLKKMVMTNDAMT